MSGIVHPKFSGFEQLYIKNKEMIQSKGEKYLLSEQKKPVKQEVSVAVESQFAFVINEKYRINILCTAQQIEALSIGYLISEGLISSLDDIKSVEYKNENMVYIFTHSSVEDIFYWTEVRTSGCIGIKQQYEKINIILTSDIRITPTVFFTAQEQMNQSSRIWKQSGGTHMSSLFQKNGSMISYAEDVGRHNTIDKIIGEALINQTDVSHCFVITSGRLSAAMISKLIRANIPIVISISAPTAQGLELAEKAYMTVVGFSRPPFFNIYTHPERIIVS